MKLRILLLAIILVVACALRTGYAGVPVEGPDSPGALIHRTQAYWLGPGARFSEEQNGKRFAKYITFFHDDGSTEVKEVTYIQPGFVTSIENSNSVIYGVNDLWKLVIRQDRESRLFATPNSSHLIRELHPAPEQIALELYVHGTLVDTIGPFLRHSSIEPNLGDDGATATLIWKDSAKANPQIALTDSGGHFRNYVNCEDSQVSPIVAPNGMGALLQQKGSENGHYTFSWYAPEHKVQSIEIGPNPHCIGWVPGTTNSLFATSFGDVYRYQMIEWPSGKKLWENACPANGQALAIGFTPKLVIFAIAELYKSGPWHGESWIFREKEREWIRTFYAVNTEDGTIVSRWHAAFPSRLPNDFHERFVGVGGRIYYVNSEEVVELSEAEINAGKNGWTR